jgi:hypothetical protein
MLLTTYVTNNISYMKQTKETNVCELYEKGI